ncbi:cyclodeaminase [Pseudooceanicola sediminis]|uniref:Cyclodeaminase n=1 Tax=Pseudooceanicola sediminis TaxID=2211117 RepID=A0A399J917_9RHOB|nr:cyclodeaminase [Pseudooceanicola sediminis]KAA2317139.1 cyclodeaminase [Puniceibacterium sp. HSS470]RII40512.1 cyclodeaminase [Pseudooceanicola sediminis]|tara:strand:+ start:112089 stop:113069 length:981 start_codon:yes stop_codon:yes gene_type:complete
MAHDVRILTEADLRHALSLDLPLIDAVEQGFASLARGGVVMPPVLSMALEEMNAEVDVKTAYVPGFDDFALKVSPGFFNNPAKGLPSLNGLMILLSAETGLVRAVFLDNGYLTDLRTAAAGAVAARHLAPEVTTAGIFGTGVQARLQARAAHLVRPFQRCLVWGRDAGQAAACARDIAAATGAACRACDDPAEVVQQSQLVVTTTPATEPILQREWLHPGLHITAMGSDQAGKTEIAAAALAAADLYVCDRVSQCVLMGELRAARAQGLMPDEPPELGEIIIGTAPARRDAQQVTICDLTGTGVQDTAIAAFAMARIGTAGTRITA